MVASEAGHNHAWRDSLDCASEKLNAHPRAFLPMQDLLRFSDKGQGST